MDALSDWEMQRGKISFFDIYERDFGKMRMLKTLLHRGRSSCKAFIFSLILSRRLCNENDDASLSGRRERDIKIEIEIDRD